MREKINNPMINSIVRHTGWRFEDNENYPCDVMIVSGAFEVKGKISNFWYWRRILSDGSLSEIERGYGSFEKTENKYKIETKVVAFINRNKDD